MLVTASSKGLPSYCKMVGRAGFEPALVSAPNGVPYQARRTTDELLNKLNTKCFYVVVNSFFN
jgi:hypothetical protein